MHVHITINTTPPQKKKMYLWVVTGFNGGSAQAQTGSEPMRIPTCTGQEVLSSHHQKRSNSAGFFSDYSPLNYSGRIPHIYFFSMGMFIQSKYKKLPVQSISASANPHFRWPPEKCASKFRGFIHGWFSINNHSYQGLLTIYVNISPKCFSVFMGFFLLVYPLLYLT